MSMTLREAVATIESGNWCSLRFITADLHKKSGGKVVELARARIARRQPLNIIAEANAGRAAISDTARKNPNHNLNFTRNLELPGGELRKVHPILITHVNNTAVL